MHAFDRQTDGPTDRKALAFTCSRTVKRERISQQWRPVQYSKYITDYEIRLYFQMMGNNFGVRVLMHEFSLNGNATGQRTERRTFTQYSCCVFCNSGAVFRC